MDENLTKKDRHWQENIVGACMSIILIIVGVFIVVDLVNFFTSILK